MDRSQIGIIIPAINESQNIKIVIGPISHEDFKNLSDFKDMIFISPSNIDPKIQNNILSIGVSL